MGYLDRVAAVDPLRLLKCRREEMKWDEMGRLGSQNLLVLLDLFYSPWSTHLLTCLLKS